jgi:hypothetical protein
VPEAASSRRDRTGAADVITDFLLDLLEGLVNWLASLLPVDTILGSENIGFQIFSGANYFFPLAELSVVVLGVIALGLPMAGVSLVIWLLVGVVRGGGAKS